MKTINWVLLFVSLIFLVGLLLIPLNEAAAEKGGKGQHKAPGPSERLPAWDKGKKEGWGSNVPPGLEKGKGPSERPPGWDKGKKEGWGSSDVPPGLEKGKGPPSRPPGWDKGKKEGWGDKDVPPGLVGKWREEEKAKGERKKGVNKDKEGKLENDDSTTPEPSESESGTTGNKGEQKKQKAKQ